MAPTYRNISKKIEDNKIPIIQWDGEQTRDLIYVKDVVDCLIRGANSDVYGGEMFLLSTNQETSVNKALNLICQITGKNINPKYEEKNPGDLRRMILSYEKAKKAFGYEPRFSLEEGIKRYVDWYLKTK